MPICEKCEKDVLETWACEKCETLICDNCTQGMTQHNNIDYTCCKSCARERDEDLDF